MSAIQTAFAQHLQQLSSLLQQASVQKDPAYWLYENNARTSAFYLQAICRLFAEAHNNKKLSKLKEHFKNIEDGIGQIDFYHVFARDFADNKKVPSTVVKGLHQKAKAAAAQLNQLLSDDGWLGKAPKRIKKIDKRVAAIDWLDGQAATDYLKTYYQKKIGKLGEEMDKPFTDVELGVHELRRDIRWLSIYPNALPGMILLKPTKQPPAAFKKYLTKAVLQSPYNQLKAVKGVKTLLQLNQASFFGLSWLIAALGKLKDEGLKMFALQHALEAFDKTPSTKSLAAAQKMMGAQQPKATDVLATASKLVQQFRKDKVLDQLV
jgi:hypothetical protein